MNGPPVLERRLKELLADYRHLRGLVVEQEQRLREREALVKKLEHQVTGLRSRIDTLNSDRFAIKRLREERKQMKRKLAGALNRLEQLEQELTHGDA